MEITNPFLEKSIQEACNFYFTVMNSQKLANKLNPAQAGKQMDGFVNLAKKLAITAGYLEKNMFTKTSIPGYFRPTKKWDLVITDDDRNLVAAIEYKSVGSRADNVNNRIEEALGSGIDIKFAYYDKLITQNHQIEPWIGYLILFRKTEDVTKIRNHVKILPGLNYKDDFGQATSYAKRTEVFLDLAMKRKIYDNTALIISSNESISNLDQNKAKYETPNKNLSPVRFFSDFWNHINSPKLIPNQEDNKDQKSQDLKDFFNYN